jgi:hypothetical protein
MRLSTVLLLPATLLLSLSCASEALQIEEEPLAEKATKGPLFLPYHFESNATSTRLEKAGGSGEAEEVEITFKNSGILQFSFRSQARLTGTERSEEFRLLERVSSTAGTAREETISSQTSGDSSSDLASLEKTYISGTDEKLNVIGSGETSAVGRSEESMDDVDSDESMTTQTTEAGDVVEGGSEESIRTPGSSSSGLVGGTTERKIDAVGAGEETESQDAGFADRTGTSEDRRTRQENREDTETTGSTAKIDESGSSGGLKTGVGRGSRFLSQSMRESMTALSVEYWEEKNETVYKLVKHDRILRHFHTESKAEYVERLKKETTEKVGVVRLVKTGPVVIEAGEPIEYRFVLENLTKSSNLGEKSIDIENIVIIDMLDVGLLYDGEYEGEISSGSTLFTFSNGDNSEQSRMPEFTTSAEWNDGKIAWMIPGVVRPGDRLTFSFRVTYFLDTGLIGAKTPLTTEPAGAEQIAMLDADRTAIRVIERNSEENWLKVSARTRDPDRTLVGYIPFDVFETIPEDDVDRERKFMENNYAARIKEELTSGKGRLRTE